MTTLTAILISKNADLTLHDCLKSLAFCDSILLLDSGSTDLTLEIASSFGVRIVDNLDWPGYGVQKQRALEMVSSEWVLSIDCDEIVSEALANEIRSVLGAPEHLVYRMPRLNHLCGRPVQSAGWYPDYVERLFAADKARFSPSAVHEVLEHGHTVGTLSNHLLHYTYPTYYSAIDKINRYSDLSAFGLRSRRTGKSSIGIAGPVARSVVKFMTSYLVRGGILGGRDGLTVSLLQAFATYLKYLKAGG